MRRPIPHTALLLVALTIGTTHAQMPRITGIAYAYASITILFGDGHAPSFELAASVYPRAEINQFCIPGARCASGMATPLGYVYDDRVFTRNPEYHTEEITHIRQWEALGPGFLLAYGLTGGEPFEPYHTRNSVIASASSDSPYWAYDRMWQPPTHLEKAHPQLRVTWGGERDETTITLFPGYSELAGSIVTAIKGEDATPTPPSEPVIANLTPHQPAVATLLPFEPDTIASND